MSVEYSRTSSIFPFRYILSAVSNPRQTTGVPRLAVGMIHLYNTHPATIFVAQCLIIAIIILDVHPPLFHETKRLFNLLGDTMVWPMNTMADFIQFIQQSLRSSSDSSSKSSQTTYEESSTRSEDDASDEESECSISTYFKRTVSLRHVRFGYESETI